MCSSQISRNAGERLEVRRQPVRVRIRRDEERPLLPVAARPHRALVPRREAGELLPAHRERRLPPRGRLLDLGKLARDLRHPLPRDHALRLTFRADGEKLVRAAGRRRGAGGDGRAAQGFFGRLRDSLGKSRRALTGELAAATFDPGNDEDWERLEEALIQGDVGVRATAELVRRLEARNELGDLNAALAEEIAEMLGEPRHAQPARRSRA